jgi:hypothetical protein
VEKMTEERLEIASEITGFAVKFWTSNFLKKNLQILPPGLTCNLWANGNLAEKGVVGVPWDFVVSRSECIVWRKAYLLCNRCMIPRREWAEPTEQNMRLLPLCEPDRPEINCPIVLLCSEIGFYFTSTELVTNQGRKPLINEISN